MLLYDYVDNYISRIANSQYCIAAIYYSLHCLQVTFSLAGNAMYTATSTLQTEVRVTHTNTELENRP